MNNNLLLTEDEQMLKKVVGELADRELGPRAKALDESEEFPWDNLRSMTRLELMGLTIGTKYGGSGGTYQQLAVATEEVARGCAATSATYIAHLSLTATTIDNAGTESQKRRFLTPLARGQKLGAWCLTEPENGSDVASMGTHAQEKDDHYIIKGTKTFITNGDMADYLVVFASENQSLGSKGISCFVVDKNSPGIEIHKLRGKMGIRASSTVEIIFDQTRVPKANRLGDNGQGFKIAMQVLDSSRIAIAAQGVGIARAAFEAGVRYSQQRQTFGKLLAEHQAIQFMLADMATYIEAARLLTRKAAILKDLGQPHSQESAMAKLYASETAHFATDKAVQIHGGYGYFKDNPVERYYRDSRITEIYEGTSEIQRIVIARSIFRNTAI